MLTLITRHNDGSPRAEYARMDRWVPEESSMTNQTKPDATLSKPVDPKEDQAEVSRCVLREMNDKADRAIDEQTGRRRS
jgi:hypothetical protein